jgi:hypothetical protein
MSRIHSEVRGSGPEPIKAMCWGGVVGEGRKAERVAHSMRERSM